MTTTTTDPADFVVLHPDGRVDYVTADPDGSLPDAIRAHVPNLASQSQGKLTMWFADDFDDPALQHNPLAGRVTAALRYPYTWFGPVALTMREDAQGHIGPLTDAVRATLDELAAAPEEPNVWTAAERHAPELLDELMAIDTSTAAGRTLFHYKHRVTRRYLTLDVTGQAWQIMASADGQTTIASHMDLADAKAFVLALDVDIS